MRQKPVTNRNNYLTHLTYLTHMTCPTLAIRKILF
jgi:hypothetical protein